MSSWSKSRPMMQRNKNRLKNSISYSVSWTMARSSDPNGSLSKFSNRISKSANAAFPISVMKVRQIGHRTWLHRWTIWATQALTRIGRMTSWPIVVSWGTAKQSLNATRQLSSSTTSCSRMKTRFCCTTRSVKQNFAKNRRERSRQPSGLDKPKKWMEKTHRQTNKKNCQTKKVRKTVWR